MKLLGTAQIQRWDQYSIANEPVSSLALMERAATRCYQMMLAHLKEEFPGLSTKSFQVIAGQGNNGGDGLVIARYLKEAAYEVEVFILQLKERGSEEYEINLARAQAAQISIHFIQAQEDLAQIPEADILIDALYGIGFYPPLQATASSLIQWMNGRKAKKIAIDIPSGLCGDIEAAIQYPGSVVFQADQTYTFQTPKSSLLFPETGCFAGMFYLVDIGLSETFIETAETDWTYIQSDFFRTKPQSKFIHKGSKGHALLIGGSYGKMGAIQLSTRSALYTGCGLATAYIPKVGYTIMQTALPEAMVQTDEELLEIRNFPELIPCDAIGLGPGMGIHPYTQKALGNWLVHVNKPLVIDADALNLCAELMKLQADFRFPANCILTPHPKEFDRLFGSHTDSFSRLQTAIEKAGFYGVVIVLKGAHTQIISPEGKVYFNSSGNNLLATAGSGDVLTGIITSLLAQGEPILDAAVRGVFLHGQLADSLKQKSYFSCIAGDLIGELKYVS